MTNPTEEQTLVQLAQTERKLHKKLANLEDKKIEAEDAVEEIRGQIAKAGSLEVAKHLIKEWTKADRVLQNNAPKVAEARAKLEKVRRQIRQMIDNPEAEEAETETTTDEAA